MGAVGGESLVRDLGTDGGHRVGAAVLGQPVELVEVDDVRREGRSAPDEEGLVALELGSDTTVQLGDEVDGGGGDRDDDLHCVLLG